MLGGAPVRERRGKAVAGVRAGAFMRTQRGGEEAREREGHRGEAVASAAMAEGGWQEVGDAPNRWVPPVGDRERGEAGVGRWKGKWAE
jgi:hypothetical protein